MSATSDPGLIPKLNPGEGRIVLSSHCGLRTSFSELSSTYPLKLLSPRSTRNDVAVVYMLTYGGGLVGGDQVNLSVDVDTNTTLVLLSQGSTKVFKARPGQRLASTRTDRSTFLAEDSRVTMQNMSFNVAAEGVLFLIPDPVTCFRSASYRQVQTFYLSRTSSLVVLDWLTSGRKAMGEEWSFSGYYSANEVWVDGKRVAKDVMLLDNRESTLSAKVHQRNLCDRLAPYSCYAMVILCGPLVQDTIRDITVQYDQISVFKADTPAEMIWSLSPMTCGEGVGAVVKVAGKETEIVKKWLEKTLLRLQEAVGIDVYQKAFV